MTPKPPRDDDRTAPSSSTLRDHEQTPPAGTATRRFPSSPKGVPVVEKPRPTTTHREFYGPKQPSVAIGRAPTQQPGESWEDDSTPPTTDPALYRAIRSLKGTLKDHAEEMGGITTQVAMLQVESRNTKDAVIKIDQKQDAQTGQLSEIRGQLGILLDDRHRTLAVTQTRMIAESTTTETLAEQVLEERRDDRRYKQRLYLKIAGGVFSGGVLVALISTLAERCG